MVQSSPRVLLTSQRNHIFETVQNRGISPSEFTFEETVSKLRRQASLTHRPTGYYFTINLGPPFQSEFDDRPNFAVSFSPGDNFISEAESCNHWPEVIGCIDHWIFYILRETQAPDLWDGLGTSNQLLQDTAEQSSDNLPFTPAELPHVRNCLEEIKAYVIKTKELTEAQRKIVDARFDHMEEAATRMGRKDWLSLVVGNLMGIAFSIALNGNGTHDLFGFAALTLKRILGTMLYLAGPH